MKSNINNTNQDRIIRAVLPPPNVTGSLHVGHALNITLQDIIFRFLRAQGNKTLWIPGTDHAGIATQLVSTRILQAEEGKTREELGREEFTKYTWKIKERHEASIQDQLKKMNIIIDWDHYKFTLDSDVYNSVLIAFCNLYEKGLIYKDKRLVHWDAQLQTALSDLEVINKEVSGKFYYIKYKTNTDQSLIIATTRPETLLGDVAICVNPEDNRYKHLIGKKAIVPIINKEIPIIADEACEMEKGSGALKITPAHDFVDFDVAKRFNSNLGSNLNSKASEKAEKLELISVIDESGKMINVPSQYLGLTVQEARALIEKELEELGILEKVESIKHSIPYGEKSGNPLEPRLTDQFFVDTKPLAEKALKAVEDGRITFYPEYFVSIYNHWLTNIEPWCISRQLWWGHRIPVWYGPDEKMFVKPTQEEAAKAAKEHYGKDVELRQEDDVLDTWFSSALWTFTTQGHPEIPQPKTDFLITGKDILFFWVARMIMMSLEICDTIPFEEVYLHGLVLDPQGRKMSKTVGNVLNPLELIEKYGSDATKLALAAKSLPGKDLKIGEKDVELERNFLTKIQNAAKFCKLTAKDTTLNIEQYRNKVESGQITHPWCQWLLNELNITAINMIESLETWQFADSIDAIQSFAHNTFCDWFLEITKHAVKFDDSKTEVLETLLFGMYSILVLMHPYSPQITEEIYQELFDKKEPDNQNLSTNWRTQIITNLPKISSHASFIMHNIKQIRSLLKLDFAKQIGMKLDNINQEDISIIEGLARCKIVDLIADSSSHITYTTSITSLQLEKPAAENLSNIKDKIEKELAENNKLIEQAEKRLADDKFVQHADPEVVKEMSTRVLVLKDVVADNQNLLDSLSKIYL